MTGGGLKVFLGALALIAALFLLVVLVTPLTIGLGWYTGEAGLRSFGHVRETYRVAYDDIEQLAALHDQACRARDAADAASGAVRDQRLTQLLAYENTYDRVGREYDAYMADHFRGKIIRPHDLPMPAPPLDLETC